MAVWRGLVAVVVAASLAACGDDGDGSTAVDGAADAAADVDAFCARWNEAMSSGDDGAFDAILEEPPAELADEALVVLDAEASGEDSPEALEAAEAILDWTTINCGPIDAEAIGRRVAPPADATFEGLEPCGTLPSFPVPPAEGAGMVLYGDLSAEDPYGGPMLGLLWNPLGDGGHAGDGTSEPVTVRGTDGVAAPITVFQQVVLPEVGSVVAWTEGEREVGLYGRGWPMAQAGELVAIAEGIVDAGDGLAIDDAALPAGFGEVYAGDPGTAGLVFPGEVLYSVQYQGEQGQLSLHGLEMDEAEFESFRFFTTDVAPADVSGHPGLRGNAWGEVGPAVATWREPDGLVVRLVGVGIPAEVVDQVAAASRELDDDEWAAVVEGDGSCLQP